MTVLGVNAHLASRSTLDLAVQAGCGSVRIDAPWPMIEQHRGEFSWSLLDDSVHGAYERGLEILLTLNAVPAWANEGRDRNIPPVLVRDWQVFVQAVAARYQGAVQYISIWNEPNIYGYWAGSVQQYVDYLFMPAAEILHARRPQMKVCGPELSTEGDWPTWLTAMLRACREHLDIVTIHCYSKDGHAVWKALSQSPKWWELWKAPSVKQIIREAGCAHLPVYVSEVGWSTLKVSEVKQSDACDQLLEGLATQPWVQKVFMFQLIDERDVGFGLYREDRSPKPVVDVIKRRQGGFV